MQSKSKSPSTADLLQSSELKPWLTSIAMHAIVGGGVLWILSTQMKPAPKNVEMTIIESPKPSPQAVTLAKPKAAPKPKSHEVFGVSKKALTADSGESVKMGNTLAKTPDKETLKPEDADSLPIPTEDYLVTAMPQLLQEVFVPYPPEAKKRGVQGVVTMDLLIDAEGKVRKADLVDGPDPELSQAATQAALSFKFKPAFIQQKAVSVRIRYAYRFVIKG